ncbi:MAG: class I SAM-dependent methyltransferase [Bacteroidetes bacterium]|nr:MAG: class I SAM-dependent methyltransferase [Bacteroidota bacterium]TAG89202.1 MAG: class I SAM-dependent methyltransferase [Bacteroidota bacterium]
MKCQICQSNLRPIFHKKVMFKYEVDYYSCDNCKFVQIIEPHWLEEAYSNAITSTDIGLVARNLYFSQIVERIILKFFNNNGVFLDYGSGYGLFVRIMRDKGLNFYGEDKYCDNLFSQIFDKNNLETNTKFELITAFEVFEHLENPMSIIDYFINISDNILFSTELQPNDNIENWHYISPENGQHISFFHHKTLLKISSILNMQLHTNGSSLHLLTKKKYNFDIIKSMEKSKNIFTRLFYKIGNIFDNQNVKTNKSLLMQDWELIKNIQKNK